MLIKLAKIISDAGLLVSDRVAHFLQTAGVVSLPGGKVLIDTARWPGEFVREVRKYRNVFDQHPRLLKPVTLNEYVLHTKLFRRHAHLSSCADKIAVRDMVEKKVGPNCLTKIYWTGTDLREARTLDLPQRFVIKSNHGSGTVLIVKDRNAFDWDTAFKTTSEWLKMDYSEVASEWHYRWIKPRLLIEEYLEGDGEHPPRDYKFFCFQGRVEFLGVDVDRFTKPKSSMRDRDFNELPFVYAYPVPEAPVERPECFSEMVELAEILSKGEPFVRVDLYDMGRPVFGELTFTPGGGMDPFEPPEYDEKFGRMI
ncbi:MAG: ATP-grasp fold amidoligase family protein [Pontiella sp.]